MADEMSAVVLTLPGVTATDEAFATDQESVEVWAGATNAGAAVNKVMDGAVPTGVTLPDAAEDVELPAALVAFTVKVYDWPFVSPGTVTGLPVDEATTPPGLLVAR